MLRDAPSTGPHSTDAISTATRIAAGDDRTSYDPVAITLHWLTAVLVLEQFVSSLIWGSFDRPVRHEIMHAHMSFGVILTAVIVVRIIWRLLPGHQRPLGLSGWVEMASKAVHSVLYALLAASAVLGFLLRGSEGKSLFFFGLEIPPLIDKTSKPTHELIGALHQYVGWTIVALATGHAVAALYHHYALKDGVLQRMVPAARRA